MQFLNFKAFMDVKNYLKEKIAKNGLLKKIVPQSRYHGYAQQCMSH
jgi:hypothetical protein